MFGNGLKISIVQPHSKLRHEVPQLSAVPVEHQRTDSQCFDFYMAQAPRKESLQTGIQLCLVPSGVPSDDARYSIHLLQSDRFHEFSGEPRSQ